MKIKFLDVLDEFTEMKFILLQVEKFDEDFFKSNGIKEGYKIVVQLQGSHTAAAGGYKFVPEYIGSSISERSCKIQKSGTTNAFSLLLNSVEDIKILPPSINVNDLRKSWLSLKSKYSTIKNKLDQLQDEGVDIINGEYKKILYKQRGSKSYNIGIVDEELKLIYQISNNSKSIIGDYLWIPIDELSEVEWIKCTEYNDISSTEKVEAC